jgi:hypothetical protein
MVGLPESGDGTELPLILREPAYAGVPVLDSTGVHVEAAASNTSDLATTGQAMAGWLAALEEHAA